MVKRVFGVTERGDRRGEDHPKASLTDEQVDHMRELYEEGFVGYRTLAKAFNVSRDTVSAICRYTRRNTAAEKFKTIEVDGGAVRVKRTDLAQRLQIEELEMIVTVCMEGEDLV